jgi:hypothetical protein
MSNLSLSSLKNIALAVDWEDFFDDDYWDWIEDSYDTTGDYEKEGIYCGSICDENGDEYELYEYVCVDGTKYECIEEDCPIYMIKERTIK